MPITKDLDTKDSEPQLTQSSQIDRENILWDLVKAADKKKVDGAISADEREELAAELKKQLAEANTVEQLARAARNTDMYRTIIETVLRVNGLNEDDDVTKEHFKDALDKEFISQEKLDEAKTKCIDGLKKKFSISDEQLKIFEEAWKNILPARLDTDNNHIISVKEKFLGEGDLSLNPPITAVPHPDHSLTFRQK